MAQSTGTLGDALRAARTLRGLKQADVGRIGHLDHSTISQVERGTRRLPRDVGRQVARELDDGQLAIALAEDATGGASAPVLNGPAVDLSRAATWVKAVEELEEAVDAGQSALRHIVMAPKAAAQEARAEIREAVLEMIEAKTAIKHVVTVICREYQMSAAALFREHRQQLQSKRYLARR